MSDGETYIKFRGMKAAGGDVDIALGDVQEFSGIAECVQVGTEKRADGERRPVVAMKVIEVDLGEVRPAPKDDQLPFEDDEQAGGDEDDDAADDA